MQIEKRKRGKPTHNIQPDRPRRPPRPGRPPPPSRGRPAGRRCSACARAVQIQRGRERVERKKKEREIGCLKSRWGFFIWVPRVSFSMEKSSLGWGWRDENSLDSFKVPTPKYYKFATSIIQVSSPPNQEDLGPSSLLSCIPTPSTKKI